ncbi:CBS domain-containing protein [Sphingobium sp. HBC34]|uniref:CBS domain-containing protein n=1 Tax=Sphingobium cyanobacteriorum TaxID=3063954 RepID=A0ABT8ZRS2_9SPHN|nr:CBS domain-containing protein [Sphingobium sp. HBC34]MDO7837215.1 CBS domain-containing protein [Sphingobium sp. HBC34]
MKISSIVNRKGKHIECVAETAPLSQAVETMHRSKIGSVVIVDRRSQEVRGIVSQQELVAATAERGGNALQLPVLMFMRKPVLFCDCQDDAASVMRAMTRQRSRHAVVQTKGTILAGLVSLGDLVAALLEEAHLEAGVLRDMARSHLLALPG